MSIKNNKTIMRKLFLTLLLAVSFSAANAIPAKPGLWRTIKLPDGREIRVELKGDEFCHFYQSADNHRFIQNNKGEFVSASIDEIAKISTKRRNAVNREIDSPRQAQKNRGMNKISYTGKKKGLIILVQFANMSFKPENNIDLYNRIINERGYKDNNFRGSVKDYFWDQSYGQLEFDFDIVGPVTMPNNYEYYGENRGDNTDVNIRELVVEACKAVDDRIDFSAYDWDGDNIVEQVFILFAGHGEANYNDPNTIWPHKSSIASAKLVLDGKSIGTYACSCELGSKESIDGIGTFCHEFSHCLGLPDMYDTQYGGCYGTDAWDLMGAGGYNGNTFCPAGYTAYERMEIGWLQPAVLKANQQISNMKNLQENPEAYIIYNDGNTSEYFLLENRNLTGWDSALPGEGLLITHVDYSGLAWTYNVVNSKVGQSAIGLSNPHERCSIVLADNTSSPASKAGDVWPYNYNKEFSNNSTPAATLYNANSDGSFKLNKSVKNITRNSDKTISFSFENDNVSDNDYELPASYLFYESFDKCTGAGGNDGTFGTNTSGAIVYDNTGWKSPSGRMADRCALFGSTTIAGQATTPAININGEYTLLFKAAPYDDKTDLTVEVAEGNATISKTAFIMKNKQWSAFSTTVTGQGDVKLMFKGKSRFYLDKVCVTNDLGTGIGAIETTTDDDAVCVFNIQGQLIHTATTENFNLDNVPAKGILIIKNGNKTMKVIKK